MSALALAVALPTGVTAGLACISLRLRSVRKAARFRRRLWDVGMEIERERDAALATLERVIAEAEAAGR